MDNFAILRTQKIKGRAHLKAAHNHNATQEHRPNHADPNSPVKIIAGNPNALDAFNDLVDKHGIKVRKNAVVAIEHVCSFSHERKDDINVEQWANDTVKFLEDKYGKENILQAALHTDEKTPHLHVLVAPVVEKQHKKGVKTTLSARDLIGGPDGPEKLQKLQDGYAEAMSKHGLERGVRGSKAAHKELRTYAAEITQIASEAKSGKLDPDKYPKQDKGFFGPDWKGYAETLKERLKEVKEKYNKKVKELTVKNKLLEKTLNQVRERCRQLEELLSEKGISEIKEENQELKSDNEKLRKQNEQIREYAADRDQQLEASKQALKSWRMGGQGLPLTPAQKQAYEASQRPQEQRERDSSPEPSGPGR